MGSAPSSWPLPEACRHFKPGGKRCANCKCLKKYHPIPGEPVSARNIREGCRVVRNWRAWKEEVHKQEDEEGNITYSAKWKGWNPHNKDVDGGPGGIGTVVGWTDTKSGPHGARPPGKPKRRESEEDEYAPDDEELQTKAMEKMGKKQKKKKKNKNKGPTGLVPMQKPCRAVVRWDYNNRISNGVKTAGRGGDKAKGEEDEEEGQNDGGGETRGGISTLGYFIGFHGHFELEHYDSMPDQPTPLGKGVLPMVQKGRGHIVTLQTATVGSRVVRGPDWQDRDADGGAGLTGTIIAVGTCYQAFEANSRRSLDGESKEAAGSEKGGGREVTQFPKRVVVRWDANGYTADYRVGEEALFDLTFAETEVSPRALPRPPS